MSPTACPTPAALAFQQRFGLSLPLVQAPMAGVQDHRLARAVIDAGGLGSLPCAMLGPEALQSELTQLHEGAAGRTYNLNFFCHTPPEPDSARESAWRAALSPCFAEYGIDAAALPPGPTRRPFDEATAAQIEAFRPPVVSFHFGLPPPALLARIKAWGACVMASATTVAEARWLEAHGADVVIAQGLEAGGHRGHFLSHDLSLQPGLFALLPAVVQAVRLPVVAAGAVADAAGVAAALALGAAAVQVGSALLQADEATTSALHRRALAEAARREAEGDPWPTALTRLYTGRPARGLTTRVMREFAARDALAPEFPLATTAITPLRQAAEALGRSDFSPLWAGQAAWRGQAGPAAELIARLFADPGASSGTPP